MQMKKIFGREALQKTALDIAYTILGSALVAAALAIFTIPNNIAPGGVSGLSTALAHITPIRVSLWSLALNVPIMLCAWRILGSHSLALTLVSTVLLSLFIELFSALPAYTNNILLAAIFAGALTGLGVGIMFPRGISTGGTDLLTLLLRRFFPNIPSGTMLMIIDAIVVLVAVLIFRDIEVALYSTVTIFASSKVIDTLAQGIDYAKVVYIVTGRGDDITRALNAETNRGCTLVPAIGGYTHGEKQLVITVTRRNVLYQTLRLIKQTDPEAFTYVTDSTEVHGEGFKSADMP